MNNKDEAIETLDQFLNATEKVEIARLATKLEPYYYQSALEPGTNYPYMEQVSPLEIAAEEGKLSQVNALLNKKTAGHTPRFKENLPTDTPYNTECAACFRAIQQGNTDVVLRLLEQPQVSNGILDLQVKQYLNKPEKKYYLDFIQKAASYPIAFNRVPAKGNVALIMAAGLPDATILKELLKINILAQQLPASGIVAFLNATRNLDGTPKKYIKPDDVNENKPENGTINSEIVNLLLKIPEVYAYACTRPHDFGSLIEDFHAEQKNITQYYHQQMLELKRDDETASITTETDKESLMTPSANNSPIPPSSKTLAGDEPFLSIENDKSPKSRF